MSPDTMNVTQMPAGDIVTLMFYVLIAIYIIFTAMLYYHWQTYATDPRVKFVTLVTYFVITIPLLLTLSAVVVTT